MVVHSDIIFDGQKFSGENQLKKVKSPRQNYEEKTETKFLMALHVIKVGGNSCDIVIKVGGNFCDILDQFDSYQDIVQIDIVESAVNPSQRRTSRSPEAPVNSAPGAANKLMFFCRNLSGKSRSQCQGPG